MPTEVIELIQQYVDEANIYIPKKADNHANWGQLNKAKEFWQGNRKYTKSIISVINTP